jgi:hypothetical protein
VRGGQPLAQRPAFLQQPRETGQPCEPLGLLLLLPSPARGAATGRAEPPSTRH